MGRIINPFAQPKKVDRALRELVNDAASNAAVFMRKLFGGATVTKCQCGCPVTYKLGVLKCDMCGGEINEVGYIRQYRPDVFIRTLVDVPKKRFKLTVNDTENFEDMVEGDEIDVPNTL